MEYEGQNSQIISSFVIVGDRNFVKRANMKEARTDHAKMCATNGQKLLKTSVLKEKCRILCGRNIAETEKNKKEMLKKYKIIKKSIRKLNNIVKMTQKICEMHNKNHGKKQARNCKK